MEHYYKGLRTPGDMIVAAYLFINERLPGNRVFLSDGSISQRYQKQAEGYLLPEKYIRKYRISETTEKNVYLMESGKPGKTIIYIHGGAYWSQPSPYHFAFLRKVLDKCGGQAVIPVYPKAPKATAEDVYAFMTPVYEEAVRKYGEENLVIMGDSAGGGFSLAFAMEMAKQDRRMPPLILISPWMDITCKNCDNRKVKDPWLKAAVLRRQGEIYAGNLKPTDARVSPSYGDPSRLSHITIITGTNDILSADAAAFARKYPSADIWIYPKRLHVFPIFPIGSARKHALNVVAEALQ